jgi:hypothetical protein
MLFVRYVEKDMAGIKASPSYTITELEKTPTETVSIIQGNTDDFERDYAGKYSIITQLLNPAPDKTNVAATPAPIPVTAPKEDKIKDDIELFIATSYGLKEGIQLWNAKLTSYNEVDKLNITDVEKQAIKDYYFEYSSAAILPKYIVMIGSTMLAVWAYIAPLVMPMIIHLLSML